MQARDYPAAHGLLDEAFLASTEANDGQNIVDCYWLRGLIEAHDGTQGSTTLSTFEAVQTAADGIGWRRARGYASLRIAELQHDLGAKAIAEKELKEALEIGTFYRDPRLTSSCLRFAERVARSDRKYVRALLYSRAARRERRLLETSDLIA